MPKEIKILDNKQKKSVIDQLKFIKKRLNVKDIKYKILTNIRYYFFSYGKNHNLDNKLIISLTSYPLRFKTLQYTLKTLLSQNIKPDLIILWLYEKDVEKLPENVKKLVNNTFSIRTTPRDTKSFKKLIPTLTQYPGTYIVTADDDIYYRRDWLQKLVENYNPDKKEVLGHRGHKIKLTENKKIMPYDQWEWSIKSNEADEKIILTGVGGIFYPPYSLHTEVLNEKKYMELCPTADDIWFYFMLRKNNFISKKISSKFKEYSWKDTQNEALHHANISNDVNDETMQRMIKTYERPF